MTSRTIEVDELSRVEGEGALRLIIRDGAVATAELRIIEPPRLFEGLLRGRAYTEAPDITARICGICPAAYQMSAVHAIEAALGIEVDGPLRALRRLLYCGEWIESHALHIYLLHAPDFLGYDGAIDMAQAHPAAVRRGLLLKQVGNALMTLIGGREIHPVNVRVGGFYRVPTRAELTPIAERLQWAREAAWETVNWVAGFEFPELARDYTLVALRHPDEYPMNAGRIASNRGLDCAVADFEQQIEEQHEARSTALHARLVGPAAAGLPAAGAYLTGPLARYHLNRAQLSPLALEAAQAAGLGATCDNPFRSILVRAVEILYACDEALAIITDYEPPPAPALLALPRAGTGHGATEAPRGLLYHRYDLNADGSIRAARIIPPTSQNQASIEGDLREFAGHWLGLPDAGLQQQCERAVRNHDPCISCATHFLRLTVEHG
ncbi:MAG: Ni/Fe hydrogenase subunit alpha [Chromatiaceae bacterium]|nr:MAG: Ni/Fe hydrogenase subunit alpha [Chromatiaceae bacterium]